MSADSLDRPDAGSIQSNPRSRSILRHFGETLGVIHRARSRAETSTEPPPVALINSKRASIDSLDVPNLQGKSLSKKLPRATTPTSFSHRLSLLNQVKSHLNKSRKAPPTIPLTNDDEDYTHLSLSPMISVEESKSSTSPFDEVLHSAIDDTDSTASEPVGNIYTPNVNEQRNVKQHSLDMTTLDDDWQEAMPSTNDNTRAIHSSRGNSTKVNDPPAQRARTALNESSSLSSVLTNTSSPTNHSLEQIYWIELTIERGKDLAIKDLNGTSDPYVKVFYGTGEKYTTNIVYKSLNPIWNEKCSFLVHDLNVPIQFQLFDYDRIGRDEAMGTTKLDLWKLPIGKSYSATLDLENEKRTDGKVGMMKIDITISPKTSEFREEILRSMAKQFNTKSSVTSRSGGTNSIILARRTIDVFIIEGRNLSATNAWNKLASPFVRLKFGTHKKYRTQPSKSTNNPKWHQSFMYDIFVSELPPLELTVIDDTGGSGDYMARGTCNLAHLDEERTHKVSVDLDDNAGTIDLFVTITGTTPAQEANNDGENSSNAVLEVIPSKLTDEDRERYDLMSTLRTLQPIFDVGKVEIKIYQARDLSAKDMNGKSDPFCVVELDTTRLRTHTIYKTLDPVWNKSFIIPVQDIHSTLELTIFDEDMNKSPEFIGKVAIPLLAISNGEKKWMTLKDRKCTLPVKGILEIEATVIYNNVKAIIRTFNPRQERYYQVDGKFRVGVFKQHINRVRSVLVDLVNLFKFINDCFQWENPLLSFCAFIISLIIVWNFELYMLPFSLLLLFARNALIEYRRGRLGKSFATLGDETVSAVIQPGNIDEDILEGDGSIKEQKKSLLGVIHGIQDTVLEIQGYVDEVASTLERVKNVFNFTVPWLSILAIVVLTIVSTILYYIPLRYLILAFIINKFTKRFRKPKDYVDNNELADFLSRLPSDPELLQYREMRIFSRLPSPKKAKRVTSNGK